MTRFVIEYIDPTEVRILVEGRVTLVFENIEGKVWCKPGISHDRGTAVVQRKDFLDARKLAIEEMAKVETQQCLSDAEIARVILSNAKRKDLSVDTSLDSFMKVAGWCSPTRRVGIMHAIGEIGGTASTQRATRRKKNKKVEQDRAKQGTFSFT